MRYSEIYTHLNDDENGPFYGLPMRSPRSVCMPGTSSPPRFLVSQNDQKYDDGRRREGVRMVTYEYSYDHSLAEDECPFGPDSENIPHKMFVVRYHDLWLWYDGVTW